MITEEQRLFMDRRKSRLKWRGVVFSSLLAVWGAYTAYMFMKNPLMINPFYLMNNIKMGQVGNSTLTLLAVLGSAALCLLSFMVMILIVFMAAAADNEARLMAIIGEINAENGRGKQPDN